MMQLLRVLLGVSVMMMPAVARGENSYPARPIRLIVTNPAGGGQDFVMRVIADKLRKSFGFTIVVDNRPKALGEIGKRDCAESLPNGYTLCSVADGVAAVQPAFYMAADEPIPGENLTPIGIVADQYFAFVVRKDRPKTFEEFLELVRTKPNGLICGSGSASTTGRLGMAILNSLPGVKVREALYSEGEPGVLRGMLSGDIDCMFASMTSALPHINEGNIKVLGTFGPLRNPFLPGVRLLSEIGYPAFGTLGSWYAIWGPPNMPRPLVEFLNRNLNDVLEDEEVRNLLAKNGVSARRKSSPEQLASETTGLFSTAFELICREKIEFNGLTCKRK